MSAQAISGAAAGVPAGELASIQRVQQLQQLIESAKQVASGGLVFDRWQRLRSHAEHRQRARRTAKRRQRLRLRAAGRHER